MRYLGTGSSNGKKAPPPPAVGPAAAVDAPGPVEVPTDVEAARLAEEESRPDGTDGGVTP